MADPTKEVAKKDTEGTDVMRELVTQLLARQPTDPNNMGLSEAKRAALTAPLTPQKYRMVKCLDEDTGVTFVATVVESKKHPYGRITAIGFFEFPDGIYVHQTNGGRVPDGMPIFTERDTVYMPGAPVQPGTLNNIYKVWRNEEFVRPVFKRYPGRGLTSECCHPKGPGLKTEWQMSGIEFVEPEATE